MISIKKNYKKLVRLIFVFILLCSSFLVFSQQTSIGVWSSVDIRKKINKNWIVKSELAYRNIYQNSKDKFLDLAVRYKLNKKIKIGLGYRYGIEQNMGSPIEYSNRLNVDVKSKFKILPKTKIEHRVRFQRKYAEMFTSTDGFLATNTLRNRIKIDHKTTKKINIISSYELFAKQSFKEALFFARQRALLGVDYQISKKSTFNCSYIFQEELQVINPLKQHIISFSYSFEI